MKRDFLNYILTVTVLLFCFSCGKSSYTEGKYFYNFDDLSPYIKNNSTLVKEAAKSGEYCLRVDSATTYGLTFRQRIGDLTSSAVNNVKLNAWVKCRQIDFLTGRLVCSVESPDGKCLYWEGQDLIYTVYEANKWTEITAQFDISKFNNVNNILVIYPLNPKGSDYLFDDLSVSVQ
jgi:hypothetical protein